MSQAANPEPASRGHDVVEIARALIACPSVTPAEGGALGVLDDLLRPAGFSVERPVFTAEGTPDVENLFAAVGSGRRHLMFAGHTDVVPPGDAGLWSHAPFSGDIADGMIYGRGAVDMKGGIAAFAAAALDFLDQRGRDFGGRISLLITGDEEGPAVNGTVKLLAWAHERGERFDAAIVGEPTNPDRLGDAIKVGRRGSLSGRVILRGIQGHVAYPHLADNPVRRLGSMIAALIGEPLDSGTDLFQPSNLEVTAVETDSKVYNVIPGAAELRFNVRFNDRWTLEALKAEVRRRVGEGSGNAHAPAEVLFEPSVSDVFLTEAPELVDVLAGSVERVTGLRPQLSTSGGTSDARFIKDYCPVVEFGLVGQTMHKIDERVPLDDLHRLTAIYRAFLDAYFG